MIRRVVNRAGWVGGGCTVYAQVDDAAVPRIGALDPTLLSPSFLRDLERRGITPERDFIYPVLGYEVAYHGDVRVPVRIQKADESDLLFTDTGELTFGLVKPDTHQRMQMWTPQPSIPRSLSDFTGIVTGNDNSGSMAVAAHTPTSGALVIYAACMNGTSAVTGIGFTGAAGLGLTQVRTDIATISGIASGFGAVFYGVGTGSEISDLVFTADGGTNLRGTFTGIEATGQHASPLESDAQASADSTSVTATLGATPAATSAVVGNMFRNGTADATAGSGFAQIYEQSSSAGSNDHINFVQFDRTSADTTCDATWTGTLAADMIASAWLEAAAAGGGFGYRALSLLGVGA